MKTRIWLVLLCAAGFGCGGGEAPVAIDAASARLKPGIPVEPRFVAGGASGDVALICGSSLQRVRSTGEMLTASEETGWDCLAASFGADGSAQRFVVRTGEGPALVEGTQAWLLPGWPRGAAATAAAFSPDGRMLAAAPAGPDPAAAVIVWSLPLKRVLTIPPRNGGAVQLLAWSRNSRSLMIADDKGTVVVHRPPKKKPVFVQDSDLAVEGPISAIDISPDGDWIVVAANAIRVRAWRLPFMNTQLKAWGRVERVFFAGESGTVITVDETSAAIRWLVNYGKVRADTSRTLGDIVKVGAPVGGAFFLGLGRDGSVHGWRSSDLEPLGDLPAALCPPVDKRP